ncbi:MAG: PIN domain-containing protein [Verrucomicrobiae bacterium]|nr:PIN domain-containing protein [Verrucomicrobiae bacterium]
MTLTVLRTVFLFLCALGGWAMSQVHEFWNAYPWAGVAIGLIMGGLVILLDLWLKGFSLRGLSAATFGLAVGTLASYLIGNSVMFSFVDPQARLTAQIITYLVVTYLAMVIALRGKDEFNIVIPYVKFRRDEKPERMIVLDTNIIIDGRIVEVTTTGFLNAVYIVPQFVLAELHRIADSNDSVRRDRGRRGFEVLRALQKSPHCEVRFHEDDIPNIREVDGKIIQLAKMLSAEILSNDQNLRRVAELQKIRVLNLNDLARALRPVLLPGERLTIKLIKEGREFDQAVAYLDDGSMVVVNRARSLVGRDVEVEVSSVLQTAAGRLAFAELVNATGAVASAAGPLASSSPPAASASVQ